MTITVVYANATTDGHILSESGVDYSHDGTYDAAIGGYSDVFEAVVGASATSLYVGQNNWEGDYNWMWDVWQAFLSFDTSAVGTDTISAAVLTTTGSSGGYAEDARARLYDWGTSLTASDWVGYASLSGYTLLAHSGLLGWSSGSTNDWTDDALAANVNKTGTTRMVIHSAGQQTYTGYSAYAVFRGPYYTGTTSDPKITITHAAGGAENYDASPTMTGGGVSSVAQSTARSRVNTLTGGGVAVIDYATTGAGSLYYGIPATGGGVVVIDYQVGTYSENYNASVASTGGGVTVLTRTSARPSVVVDTGGGVTVLTRTSSRTRAVVDTGGGVLALGTIAKRGSSVADTGGGVVSLALTGAHKPSVVDTGGGIAVLSRASSRSTSATDTGGGVASVSVTGSHKPSVSDTGGGVVTLTRVANRATSVVDTGGGILSISLASSHSASPASTGGGIVTISYVAQITGSTNKNASVQGTGGGVVVVSQASSRYRAEPSTGGGVAFLTVSGAHSSVVLVSGGGIVAIDDIAFIPNRDVSVRAVGGGIVVIDYAAYGSYAPAPDVGAGPATRRQSRQASDYTISDDDEAVLALILLVA